MLELYDLEIHQKKGGPDYHRLKTMVKRSIKQNLRIKNFEARNGNYEKNAVVKNPGNTTACTKNSWRLMAMGVQRAVFQWRELLAIQKGLTFYQTRSNAIILQGILPAYCIPKVVRLKTGEVLYEKVSMSPRPPQKISFRHDHDWTRGNDELSSTVEQQPVGKLVQQSLGEVQHATFSQPAQPKPKPICDRSVNPENTEDVFVVKGETSRSHEIDEKGLHEEVGSSDRSVKPERLSENIRVKHAQGNLLSETAQAHTQ